MQFFSYSEEDKCYIYMYVYNTVIIDQIASNGKLIIIYPRNESYDKLKDGKYNKFYYCYN